MEPKYIEVLEVKSMNKFRKDFFHPCPFLLPSILLYIAFTLPYTGKGQTFVQPIDLTKRAQQSTLIIEGRVVDQESFWKNDSSGLYTRSQIEVYKGWKRSALSSYIYLITPGGKVGNFLEQVTPSLSVNKGEVGVFFLERVSNLYSHPSDNSAIPSYQAYSSLQGFITYDETTGKAKDLYKVYSNIHKDLYQRINEQVGNSYNSLRRYTLSTSKISSRSAMSISSFTPSGISAGTGEELTIRGSDFGERGEASSVFFPNADNGGSSFISVHHSDIINWTDTEIVVRVPSGAGTGKIKVKNADSQLLESSQTLTVTYSHINISAGGKIFRPFLTDRNNQGGYTLQYSTNSDNNGIDFTTIGQAPFERALDTWRCATGVQFQIGETTNSAVLNASNAPNLIMFANDENTLPAGVLGRTNSWFISCDGKNWLLDGFDMIFRQSGTGGITWNFDESEPCGGCYDFESVSLHEIGHAHLLGHVINSQSVMHYSIHNGANKRTLESGSSIFGASRILGEKSGEHLCFSFYPGMTPEQPSCGVQIASLRAKVYLEGFFQEEAGSMHQYLLTKGLLPDSPDFAETYGYFGPEQVANFPDRTTDWIFVQLLDPQDSTLIAQQAVLLRADGMLMDTEGNEFLTFQGLDAGDYLLSIQHKGHLGIISSQPVSLGSSGELYDFTRQGEATPGEGAQKLFSGVYMMYAGDYTLDGRIDDEDFHAWRQERALINGYSASDGNGDGQISVQDANLWMQNRNRASALYFQKP